MGGNGFIGNIDHSKTDKSRLLSRNVAHYENSKNTTPLSYTTDLHDHAGNYNFHLLRSLPKIFIYNGVILPSRYYQEKTTSPANFQPPIIPAPKNETTALRPIGSASTIIEGLTVQASNSTENREPSKRHSSNRESSLLLGIDILIVFLLIGPLVSVHWYCTWTLCDRYFFSGSQEASYWLSAGLGLIIITVATFLQDPILKFSSNRTKPVRYVVMRLFNYIMSFASVSQWRGVWDLQDYYAGISTGNALMTLGLTTGVLLLLRGQRSVLYPPTSVSLDLQHGDHYKMATFFSVQPGPTLVFMLDTVFTVFIFEPVTISVWRGLWELADCQLFPEDGGRRAFWCLVGSYSIGFILSVLQTPTRRLAAYLEKISWHLMLMFESLVTFLYVVFTVISWRGIWLLFEVFAPQDEQFLWMCHFLSFGVLVIGLSASSAMTQVGPKDGSQANGEGVTLDLNYLTKIINAYREHEETANPAKE